MPEEILETFECYVYGVNEEDDIAFINLRNKDNEYVGKYPASKLKEKDIGESDRFTIKTIGIEDDLVRIDIELIPRRELTDEEM